MQLISISLFCLLLTTLSESCTYCQSGCGTITVDALSYNAYQVPYNCQSGFLALELEYRATDGSAVELYFMTNSKWDKVKNGEENWPKMISDESTECLFVTHLSGSILEDSTLVVYCPNIFSNCDGLIRFQGKCTDGSAAISVDGASTTENSIGTTLGVNGPTGATTGVTTGDTSVIMGGATGLISATTSTSNPVPGFVHLDLFSDSSCSNKIFSIEEKLHISSCPTQLCAAYGDGTYISKYCHFQSEASQPEGNPTIVQTSYDDILCQNFQRWTAYYLDMEQCYKKLNQTFHCQGSQILGLNYNDANCSQSEGPVFSLGDDTCNQGVKLTTNPCVTGGNGANGANGASTTTTNSPPTSTITTGQKEDSGSRNTLQTSLVIFVVITLQTLVRTIKI